LLAMTDTGIPLHSFCIRPFFICWLTEFFFETVG
jgi:hypothetical protein